MKKITNNKIILGILIVALFLLTAGITYAYFSIVVSGNEEAKTVNVTTTTLSILFTDGPEISLKEAMPGASITKTFSVYNSGVDTGYYKINFQEFYNEIINDELTVSMTCKRLENGVESGKCNNLREESLYNRDIKSNIEIEKGITHEYTIVIKFIDTKQNQNVNQGKSFSGVLQIEESEMGWEKLCDNNNSLRCKLITDNIVYRDDEASTYVTNSAGVNFAAIS